MNNPFSYSVRKIKNSDNEIYLTFDDGPNALTTAPILDTLKTHNVHATFFVVGKKLLNHTEIVKRALSEGHTIGNHSLDHTYSAFFGSRSRMKTWVEQSELTLKEIGVLNSVGFRSPVGICTPELVYTLKELNLPLILWNVRFYDAVFRWTEKKAENALESMVAGSIVLLHDDRPARSLDEFLLTLNKFIVGAKKKGFIFKALTQQLCLAQNAREFRPTHEFERSL